MIGNNIKFYRLIKGLSQAKLATAVGVSKMAISNYETDKRIPDYNTLGKLSDTLGVPFSRLLANGDSGLIIKHGSFRKQSAMSKMRQQIIFETIDRHIAKIYEVVSFIGDFSLPPVLSYERKPFNNYDSAGSYLRQTLNISSNGPVGNIIDILENHGFIICPINYDGRDFSGNSGFVNNRPYIAINITMPPERQRFTLIHELAHLVFVFKDEQNQEQLVDSIAGAFLFPRDDVIRELGPKRRDIRGDLRNIQREYGISMASIIMRAFQTKVINKDTYMITMKWMSANGLQKNENSKIPMEKTHLLEQLISRAVGEDEVSISKAAELLELPLLDVRKLCYGAD